MIKKTDNANLGSKLALRRYMLDKYHADGQARVFDCCQGSGIIWGELKKTHQIAHYWGVDEKPKAGRLKIDSVKVLQQPDFRADVIDIDTYGSPWRHWNALVKSLINDATIFLTIGMVMYRGGSGLSEAVRTTLGIPSDWNISPALTGKLSEMAVNHLLTTGYSGCILKEVVESPPGPHARYLAVRLTKTGDDARTPPPDTQRKLKGSKRHVRANDHRMD